MAEERPILIENDAGAARPGILRVCLYSRKERWARALKMLGLMWLLAVVTVFIPIAHFVLVPGFLIAGPVTAVMRFQVSESVESASGECPTCGEAMTVALDPAARLPLWTYCTPANDPIRLRNS
ncbi:MAG: hypothetical protein IT489_04830 [Gammaproteobacteria bacterium]|nr:hypothetical protein [Gammaproteobacteria bacterium]